MSSSPEASPTPPTGSRPGDADPGVLRMAAPLVVSFVMRAAFTFVDTVYAAILGDAAVAAIGLTVPFEFIMIAVWVGLSTGLTSGLSRAMGAEQDRKVEQYLSCTWKLVVAVAPLFLFLGAGVWWGAYQLGLEADVAQMFSVYGAVLIGGSAFTAFWSVIPDSIVKAHQDTRSTMWAGIWSNVINVSLNTLFLFVFHWGIFGIAFSTVLGRIGGLTYALVKAREHEERRKAAIVTSDPTEDRRPYRTILSLAVPASLTFTLMATETAVINALLATLEHATAAIAAYSIFYRVQMFALQPIIATTVAMLPYAARRFGLGDLDGVRRGLRQAGLASAAYSALLVGPVMLLFGPTIAGWLAEAPQTARYAEFALQIVPLGCLAAAPFLLDRPVFEAMGRGMPGLVMAAIRYLGLTVPLAWAGLVAARGLGWPALYGVIVALLVVSALSSGIFSVWLKRVLDRMAAGKVPLPEEPEEAVGPAAAAAAGPQDASSG